MNSTQTTSAAVARDQAVIDRVKRDLLSGKTFALASVSYREARQRYGPVVHGSYAHALAQVAALASLGDSFAQIASALLPIPLYQTGVEMCAVLWEKAHAALAVQYDDVVGRSAPDAHGRPSSYLRDWSLAERLIVHAAVHKACDPESSCVPGLGWAYTELARQERILIPRAFTEARATNRTLPKRTTDD